MPDYAFNTQLSPAAPQSSMGDMLNLARGVQAYQQAAQANPLLIQQAQQALQKGGMEIEQLKKTQPLAERQLRAQAETAEAGTLGALNALTLSNRQLVAQPFGTLARSPEGGNIKYYELLANKLKSDNPTNKEMISLVDNQLAELKNLQSPDDVKRHAALFSAILQSPETFAPSITTTPEGRQVITQKSAFGEMPTSTIGTAGGLQTGEVAPETPTGDHNAPVAPYHPKRSASVPYLPNPGETNDQLAGQKYINSMTDRQLTLGEARRNLDDVIKTATGLTEGIGGVIWQTGPVATLKRKLSQMFGDPTYIKLQKELANVQIANMMAMGGSLDTVAGQQLLKMANGDETYPPDVLIEIARKTYASTTNLDMQATAADKYARKYGDNNMRAFKQMWSKNADSKVFEAINIFNSVKEPEKRKKAIDDLLNGEYAEKIAKGEKISPEEKAAIDRDRRIFAEKYKNIKKLEETGSL